MDCYYPWLEPGARGGRCDLLTSCNGMWPGGRKRSRWKTLPGRGVGGDFKVINELEFLGAAKTSNFCLVALELKLGSCF